MANLVIRPASGTGNKVVVQDQAGGAVITTGDSGATIANATLTSPTLVTPALGTVTSGNLSNSAIVYPAGHVVQVVYVDYRNPVAYGAGEFKVMTATITPKRANSKYLLDIRVSHDKPNAANRDSFNFTLAIGYSATSTNTAADYTTFGGRSGTATPASGLTVGDGNTLFATDVPAGTDQGPWGSDYETPTKAYMVESPTMGTVGVDINFGLWLTSQTSWVLSGPHYFLNAGHNYNGGVSSITITEVAQ
jgi:hypothetical protein